jgi:iron-sulfur cluster assembly accessory protein
MSIILTEAAAIEVNRIIEEQNLEELKYVRIGVVGGGCSGFQYDFNFTDKFDSKVDTMQEQHGVGVVVDKKSDLFLDGTTVDFYSGLDKRGFMFDNPNAVKSCGCGSSFSA